MLNYPNIIINYLVASRTIFISHILFHTKLIFIVVTKDRPYTRWTKQDTQEIVTYFRSAICDKDAKYPSMYLFCPLLFQVFH